MLLQAIIHNLDWSPAKGSHTGFSLRQVDFKISAVVIEVMVLRLHSSMGHTEEGGKISYVSPRCSVFLRQKFALMNSGLNILDCTSRDDWALHVWKAEACRSISCSLGVQAPEIKAVYLQGSHDVGSLHIRCPSHLPFPGVSPYL